MFDAINPLEAAGLAIQAPLTALLAVSAALISSVGLRAPSWRLIAAVVVVIVAPLIAVVASTLHYSLNYSQVNVSIGAVIAMQVMVLGFAVWSRIREVSLPRVVVARARGSVTGDQAGPAPTPAGHAVARKVARPEEIGNEDSWPEGMRMPSITVVASRGRGRLPIES